MKLVLTALLVLPCFAQAPADSGEQPPIRVDVTRVSLLFTVQDKKGRFITDLSKDEFQVVENKEPQTIAEFSAESDLPLRLAILIETGNTVRERFRFQQDAAINFIETAVRPGGGAALYDAIFTACRDHLTKEQPADKFRRAMIILGDGEDNQSRWTREQALEMAQKADVVIYTISTNISRIDTAGDKTLRYFAQETGGQAFVPFQASDLDQSFEDIANELRHQYIALYRPEPLKADGLYHTVEIKVKSRKDLIVRARHGYYAPLANR